MIPPRKKSSDPSRPRPDERGLGEADPLVSRERFVDLSRNYLSILKKNVIDFRAQSKRGKLFVRDYSHIVDAIVGALFQRALSEHEVRADKAGIAIVGMGGYGRAELAPFSDVDILVFCKRKTQLTKQVASTFVRLMWDVGFELGHTVESLIESKSTLARHMDTRTALYESRWICGSRSMASVVEREVKRLRRADRETFLVRKVKDAVTRHEKYLNSYQLIEPNVKLSPGGMRDYQTLVWLGMVSAGELGLSALRKKGLLLSGEARALDVAYDFLLRVRVELHVATASKQDQLTVQMQRLIAERLGYRARGGHLAVELFMKDYFRHTRTIYRITEDIIDELQFGGNVGILLGRKKVRRAENRLSLRVSRARIRKEPLYVFFEQKMSGLKLDRALKRRLEVFLSDELGGRSARSLMRRQFPALLATGRNLGLVLRSMHDTGFLGAVIPEYNALTSLKRYDMYHHYTVDEHSFKVVDSLSNLASTESDPLTRVYNEISNKSVLYLTALLHDIGKIEGRGHAKKGAALARKILTRMRVKAADIDSISFLIQIHLVMSDFAQRRDPSDLGTLRSFCDQVRDRHHLKLLTLLTYADLNATSPLVWTEWKRSLLWGLYLRAYDFMAKTGKEPEAIYKARKQELLTAFTAGHEYQHVLEHLDMLPGRYLLTMNAAQVRAHIDLIDALATAEGVVAWKQGKLATEITFCTVDKPFRLSQLCGVLTMNDCNILFAHAFTRNDGKVIDVFHVEDISGTDIDDARVDKIRADLIAVLKNKIDIHVAVEKHMIKWKRKKDTSIPHPLKVEFENDISGDMTIMDILVTDQPGLLFRLTRALSEEGLTIQRARISTQGNLAIDSFDVHDQDGQKVTSVERLRRIRERLEEAVG